jgi:hypothetical protein
MFNNIAVVVVNAVDDFIDQLIHRQAAGISTESVFLIWSGAMGDGRWAMGDGR